MQLYYPDLHKGHVVEIELFEQKIELHRAQSEKLVALLFFSVF